MKKIYVLLFAVILSFGAHANDAFVEGMQDIPLPTGAQKQPAHDFEFGNDDTQLVEVYYVMPQPTFDMVKTFYRESMPQLGWKKHSESKDSIVFERGDEEITIALEASKPLTVRLTLTGHAA